MKRFVVSHQDPKDKTCFKDVDECATKAEAIRKADAVATPERAALVFERYEGIVYRTDRKERPEPFNSRRKK